MITQRIYTHAVSVKCQKVSVVSTASQRKSKFVGLTFRGFWALLPAFRDLHPALHLDSTLSPAVIRVLLLAAPKLWCLRFAPSRMASPLPSPHLSTDVTSAVLQAQFMCLFEVLPEILSPPSGSHIISSSIYHFCS